MKHRPDIKGKILWVDDEIELLKPHIILLENRGYKVTPVANAEDGIELIQQTGFDLVLLDEMLNGMDGLTALSKMKDINPSLPIIMVTKNEEETLMEDAIGAKIDDYLTKPVNPSQILLICKKILESKKIESERLSRNYAAEFNQITTALMEPLNWEEWINIHVKLSEWEVELDQHPDVGLRQTISDQRHQCNVEFGKYIDNKYAFWLNSNERPPLSVDIVKQHLVPLLEAEKNTVFLILDNLRLDQWFSIEPMLYPYFNIFTKYYYSILPTATPYSRNAIFAGLFPSEIADIYTELWQEGEDDELSHNRYERQLLDKQLRHLGVELKSDAKYIKILDINEARV